MLRTSQQKQKADGTQKVSLNNGDNKTAYTSLQQHWKNFFKEIFKSFLRPRLITTLLFKYINDSHSEMVGDILYQTELHQFTYKCANL